MPAEAWFWRIHALADDFGVFRADPILLRNDAAGRRNVTVEEAEAWLKELADAVLVKTFEVGADRFGEIVDWMALQPAGANGRRVRRFPAPPWVSPATSGGSPVDPGESESADSSGAFERVSPGECGLHNHHHQDNHQDKKTTTNTAANGALYSPPADLNDDQAEAVEVLVEAGVSAKKAREIAIGGAHPDECRAVVKAIKGEGTQRSRGGLIVHELTTGGGKARVEGDDVKRGREWIKAAEAERFTNVLGQFNALAATKLAPGEARRAREFERWVGESIRQHRRAERKAAGGQT